LDSLLREKFASGKAASRASQSEVGPGLGKTLRLGETDGGVDGLAELLAEGAALAIGVMLSDGEILGEGLELAEGAELATGVALGEAPALRVGEGVALVTF
jgi:hypothetical protein